MSEGDHEDDDRRRGGRATNWPTADPVADRARTTPDRIALVDADEEDDVLTYRQYDERVERYAAGLAALDASRVGLLLEPGFSFAAAFFAAMRTGTTVVPLSLRATIPELDRACALADVDAVVCGPETVDRAAELAVDRLVALERGDGPDATDEAEATDESIPSLGDVRSSSDPRRTSGEPRAFDRTRTQLVLFTSGTTGEPKGVRLTVENLAESAVASAFRLGITPDDRWLCCLPTYHMGGLAPILRSAVYGTVAVIQRSFDADETARVVDAEDVTGISLVPTMLDRLLDAGWSPSDGLRFVLLGGAPASRDLLERSLAADVPVHPTYGLTETASQVATATPEQVASHPDTVGQPLAPTRVTVVDRSGDPLPAGERGELVVDGPTVTPGYLDPAHTEDAFGEYGLHTGDVGYRDEDGRLWVTGRLDDRIVTGGENVDPAEVRAVLLAHPGVEAAAVVGLPDDEWGERVGALLVPADHGSPPSPGSIRDHFVGRLAGYKRPRAIAVVEGLPRTDSGTVDRDAARKLLLRDGRPC